MSLEDQIGALAERIADEVKGKASSVELATVPWTAPYIDDLDDAPLGWASYNESLATSAPPIGNGVVQTFVSGDLRYQTAYGGDSGNIALRLSYLGTWGSWKVIYGGHEAWSDIISKPSTFPPESHTHDDRYYTESEVDSALAGKAAASHSHTASQISDSTSTGRAVLTATDAAAARAAIGAGTSNLALGTSGSTAAAGNDSRLSDARTPTSHSHAQSDVTGLTSALTAKVGTDGTLLDARVVTQAAYNALGAGRPSTRFYVIVG